MTLASRLEKIEQKQLFISCIVPVYNEEAVIGLFLPQLITQLNALTPHYEMIIIDDGSVDGTQQQILPHLTNPHLKLLTFSRNFGKELALTAGLEHCQGDVALLIDGDFEHPLELISLFIKQWGQGYDMVYGMRKDLRERWLKQRCAQLFYHIMTKIADVPLPPNGGDFRLLDRKVIDVLNQFDERERMMKGLYAWVGFSSIGIPFQPNPRLGGKSSWSSLKLVNLAITGIISFSAIPLRLCSLFGFLISGLSLIYALYIVTNTLLFGADLPGFATLIVAITFLGGIQLISIGIVGEYIARIYTEIKHRPKYVVKEKVGFDHNR